MRQAAKPSRAASLFSRCSKVSVGTGTGPDYQDGMIGDTPAPAAAPYSGNAVEGHGLVKNFGSFRAVDGIDIAVPAGTIYGILGPNGAGKTTLLRTLLGIVDPDEGHRTLLGADQPLRMARLVSLRRTSFR